MLTTHSMEEAESLCTRIGIMVEGRFKVVGTPQEIKNTFGQNIELQLKIKDISEQEWRTLSTIVARY